MHLTWDEIQAKAISFSKRWKDARKEEAQAQSFETDFLLVGRNPMFEEWAFIGFIVNLPTKGKKEAYGN